jgi:hypothetical protein
MIVPTPITVPTMGNLKADLGKNHAMTIPVPGSPHHRAQPPILNIPVDRQIHLILVSRLPETMEHQISLNIE